MAPKLYDWGDGRKVHTISKQEHDRRTQATIDARTVLRPPPGKYDPDLDAQERATNRGLGDLILDVAKQRERGATDLGIGVNDLGRQRTELGEDYGTSKAGAFSASGAALQAARKREANQALDRAPIDTAYQRFIDTSQTTEGRLGEDKTTSLDDLTRQYNRGNAAIDRSGGQMGLTYDRSMADLTDQQARAERENTQFGLDTAAARQYAAKTPLVTVPGAAEAARIAARQAKAAHDKAVAAAKKKARR